MTLAPEVVEAFTPIAKELGLSQEAAQKLVDFHTSQMKSLTADPVAVIKSQEQSWSAATLADPDISAYALDGKTGIEAVKLDIGRAKAILDPATRAEFDRVMNWTGIGSNPAFVKAFWRIGQHITEGRPVAGAGPSTEGQKAPGTAAKPTPAKALYPNLG